MGKSQGLTDIDIRTLDFIVAYEKEHLFPPSIREICINTGSKSPSSVFMRLRKLAGYNKLSIDENGRITLKGYILEKASEPMEGIQ